MKETFSFSIFYIVFRLRIKFRIGMLHFRINMYSVNRPKSFLNESSFLKNVMLLESRF